MPDDIAVSNEGRQYSDYGKQKNESMQNMLKSEFVKSHIGDDLWVVSDDGSSLKKTVKSD